MRINVATILAVVVAAASPFAMSGETDSYGNEIMRDVSGEVTYQFWRSGAKAEVATRNRASETMSPGTSFITTTHPSSAVATMHVEARYRTWLESLGASLKSTKFRGCMVLFF